MKILVVNLLRLGDVIATAPAVKAIRGRYPEAEIHMLVNSNFESAAKLIVGVNKTLCFDRDRLQASCVEAERPFFEAYDWLQGFFEETSSQGYDLIYNFTHNRLSGWLCGLIPASKKIGLTLDGSGAVSFGSAWFRHLNQQVDFDDGQAFNHSDVFIGAAGGWAQAKAIGFFDDLLIETDAGRAEAQRILGDAAGLASGEPRRVLALQLSTSDAKKEWGDSRYRALVELTLRREPGAVIFVIGAPGERERIENFCRSVEADPGHVRPAILSLSGIVSFLENIEILVTGDTSIKHFAAAGSTRIVEIVVGSADAHRTGSWKAGDFVVTSRELCAPCGHSEKCHRTSHACAIGIAPEAIADVLFSILKDETAEVRRARLSAYKTSRFYEVDRSEGVSSLMPLDEEGLSDASLALCLERSARRLALESRDGAFDRSSFGSEILAVKSFMDRRFGSIASIEMRHALSDGETRLRHAEGIVNSLQIQLSRLKEAIQDPRRISEVVSSVIAMSVRLGRNPWTRFVAEPLAQTIEDDRSAPFVRFRKLSDAVNDLKGRLEIALKLIRGLETEFENETTSKRSMGDRP